MKYPQTRPLLLTICATGCVWIVAGIAITAWSRIESSHAGMMWLLWLDRVVAGIILLLGCFVAWRIAQRAGQHKTRHDRLVHLAEVGLLAGGLAHEVRNVLNAMQSHLSLLRRGSGKDAAQVERQVQKLEHAVTDLEDLLTDFLTFARPAKNQLEEVHAADVLGEVVDFVALDCERSGVQIELSGDDAAPVFVDRAKLRRAFLNLVVNAQQATAEGGKITLRVGSHRDNVVIEVQDTGAGIPVEEQSRIFQTFFSTKSEGTGLGLSIVKRTIEDFGGQISFHSEYGKGTTFRIVLPAAERHRAAVRRQARAHPELQTTT